MRCNIVKAGQKTVLLIAILIGYIVGGLLYEDGPNLKKLIGKNTNSDVRVKTVDARQVGSEIAELTLTIVEEKEVYGDLTMSELAAKLDRSLKNELAGKGELIASYSIANGVDPFIATAIMLHETGCEWNCSKLVKQCNNVGGQKGKGNCGAYRSFETLDLGIKGCIDNLAWNYFRKGLNTPEQINRTYAANPEWHKKINNYVAKLKAA